MIASPCVDLCRLDGRTGICTGCLRTAEEIRRWRKMTDHQRRRIMDEMRQRRARLDRNQSRKAAGRPQPAGSGEGVP